MDRGGGGRGGRRSQTARGQTPRFRATFSVRNLRSTLAGVAIGVSIGSVGVLVALGKLREEDDADELHDKRPQRASAPGAPNAHQPLHLQHEALRYGAPSTANVLVRSGYVVSYDFRTRNASWVLEYLTKDSLFSSDDAAPADRTKSAFATDALAPEPFRVHPNVFLKSGYDKGHLAPARDMAASQQAMNESFLMTNISPQVGVGFNRGYWSRFEGFVRHLAGQFDGLYVVTGPLFLPTKHKKTGEFHVKYALVGTPPDAVAVPTHFFKVVLGRKKDGSFAAAGFVLPNKAIPDKKDLRDFLTPIDVIERSAGLLFFEKLSSVDKLKLCAETKCALAKAAYRRVVADK